MRSNVWRQIIANILQKTLQIPQIASEATSLGAALVAGVGIEGLRSTKIMKMHGEN
ncbi:FGGY-family carbohydrate kinase [Geobacillus subterraneus]|uniref:FGGY-family carbohydrate kinase n=1 Tax=Geobacillus subterraneus TaxID=129338 RepID=UPI0016145B1A